MDFSIPHCPCFNHGFFIVFTRYFLASWSILIGRGGSASACTTSGSASPQGNAGGIFSIVSWSGANFETISSDDFCYCLVIGLKIFQNIRKVIVHPIVLSENHSQFIQRQVCHVLMGLLFLEMTFIISLNFE